VVSGNDVLVAAYDDESGALLLGPEPCGSWPDKESAFRAARDMARGRASIRKAEDSLAHLRVPGVMQFNVHEAKTQFSRLLELVADGESVVIAHNGSPVAELVPYRKKGIQLGAGRDDLSVDHGAVSGDWWKAMTDAEVEEFFNGR